MAERAALPLTEAEEVEQVVQRSHAAPALLFLHDRGCPISRYVWRQMQQLPEAVEGDSWLVDVTRARAVSRDRGADWFAARVPQALLLRDGRAVWDASHFDITAEAVRRQP